MQVNSRTSFFSSRLIEIACDAMAWGRQLRDPAIDACRVCRDRELVKFPIDERDELGHAEAGGQQLNHLFDRESRLLARDRELAD